MTFVANKMMIYTSGFGVCFLMAKLAFRKNIAFKIFEGCFADKTFFLHGDSSLSFDQISTEGVAPSAGS